MDELSYKTFLALMMIAIILTETVTDIPKISYRHRQTKEKSTHESMDACLRQNMNQTIKQVKFKCINRVTHWRQNINIGNRSFKEQQC